MNYHFRWLLQPNAFFACLSVMGVHCTSLFCGKIGTEKNNGLVWFTCTTVNMMKSKKSISSDVFSLFCFFSVGE